MKYLWNEWVERTPVSSPKFSEHLLYANPCGMSRADGQAWSCQEGHWVRGAPEAHPCGRHGGLTSALPWEGWEWARGLALSWGCCLWLLPKSILNKALRLRTWREPLIHALPISILTSPQLGWHAIDSLSPWEPNVLWAEPGGVLRGSTAGQQVNKTWKAVTLGPWPLFH